MGGVRFVAQDPVWAGAGPARPESGDDEGVQQQREHRGVTGLAGPDEHDQRATSADGEVIARAVTNNLYRFVVPAVAGPARLVPLASLTDDKAGVTITALRAAAERGRLKAQKAPNGTWLSSRNWVDDYQQNTYKRS